MTCAMLLASLVIPTLASAAVPEGWVKAGSDQTAYTVELDQTVVHEGKSSVRLASTTKPNGFGNVMQTMEPSEYRGKRLRFSGFVKTAKVGGWAGLWMRVDGPDGSKSKSLAFDNMQNRPIKGTKDWTRYEVVLDVPVEATAIAFGVLMEGEGELWLDDVKFDIVDATIPSTDMTSTWKPKAKPENLDFER